MPINVYRGYYKENISLSLVNANKFIKSIANLTIQSANLS